jgi:hypothetical protein
MKNQYVLDLSLKIAEILTQKPQGLHETLLEKSRTQL